MNSVTLDKEASSQGKLALLGFLFLGAVHQPRLIIQ